MALGPRLDLRQSQSLVMTPQLQQAIRLLALSNLEVESFIAEELEKNPLLDTVAGSGGDDEVAAAPEPEPEAAGDEFGMGSVLDNRPVVYHENPVRRAGGLEAMRDEHGGAAAGHQAHGALHSRRRRQVEVGGRLVQQQDRRADQQSPRQAQQLALSGGG